MRMHDPCVYCGRVAGKGEKLTIEHVIALNKGGKDRVENRVAACFKCNQGKADRSVLEVLLELQHKSLPGMAFVRGCRCRFCQSRRDRKRLEQGRLFKRMQELSNG